MYIKFNANSFNNYIQGYELPSHMYTTPYETKNQRQEAFVTLRREYEAEVAANLNAEILGLEIPFPNPLLKTRKADRKGGIDWFIYRQRILNPLLYPFTAQTIAERPEQDTVIMEDNAPAHVHHYHNVPRAQLGLTKLV